MVSIGHSVTGDPNLRKLNEVFHSVLLYLEFIDAVTREDIVL